MLRKGLKRCKGNGKWILFSAVVLAMALCTASYAMKSFRSFMHGPGGREFVKERILSHVDYTMQELRLSPEQHARYAIIRTKMERGIEAAADRHDAMRDTIHRELANPEPDVRGLAETMKERIRAMPDTVTVQIDYLLEVYDILTPEQQTELIARFKEHDVREGDHRHGLWHDNQS